MTISGKWVLRTGALLVVLGFVLPALTVSCSGMPGLGRTFTLAQIAGEAEQPSLYLIPIGALIAGALSLIPALSYTQNMRLFYTQVGCMVAGLLSMLVSYFSLSNQVHEFGGFEMSPEYGLFVLLGGYLGAVVGFWLEWQALHQNSQLPEEIPKYPPDQREIAKGDWFEDEVVEPSRFPFLEPIQGSLTSEPVFIRNDSFSIGRGSENDLRLQDPKVSRQHARLRFAQNAWFIQDQGSAGGIFVNTELINAVSVRTGDQIKIGDHIFIFHEF